MFNCPVNSTPPLVNVQLLDKKYNDAKNKVYTEYRVPLLGGPTDRQGCKAVEDMKLDGRRCSAQNTTQCEGQNANCSLAPCTSQTFPYMSKQQLYLGGEWGLEKAIKGVCFAYKFTPPTQDLTTCGKTLTQGKSLKLRRLQSIHPKHSKRRSRSVIGESVSE